MYYLLFFSDEDMMSMASLLSTNNSDIAPLEDFDEEELEGTLIFIVHIVVGFKT